jgi:nicotinamidase-related amidase
MGHCYPSKKWPRMRLTNCASVRDNQGEHMSATPRRALIVIDVQNEYVSGNLPIAYPPVQHALANIGLAMDAAHAAGVPVIVVQNHAAETAPLFAHGSTGWELHATVAERPRDHYIQKTLPGAFTETNLGQWLNERSVDTLAVAGFMTHNCNAATIIHAIHAGLAVEFLADASGSVPYANDAGHATAEEIHRVFSVVFHSRFAAVLTTRDWIAAVKSGQATQRGSIFASNQRARGLT